MLRRNLKRLVHLGEGILVGVSAGVLVVLYRYFLEIVFALHGKVRFFVLQDPLFLLLWLSFLGFLGWVVGSLVRIEPLAAGGGIPHVKGVLQGKLGAVFWRVLLVKFLGGVVSLGAGLSLGREGPSVQIGAMVGYGWSAILRKPKIRELWVSGGASAGIAAAFGTPLAGVIFSLEELHRGFSSTVVVSALAASCAAHAVTERVFGMGPILHLDRIAPLPLSSYGVLLLFGLFLGGFGSLFNRTLLAVQDAFASLQNLSLEGRAALIFLLSGVLGLLFPEVLGGGHHLIAALGKASFSPEVLILLCSIKFLFTMVSYASSAPGGVFFPLLTIGALFGRLFATPFGERSVADYVVLGMAGYFSAITRAPITGSVLIVEMTGSFSILPAVVFTCLVSYFVSDPLKTRPIYDTLLERLVHRRGVQKSGTRKGRCVERGEEV